MNKKIFAIFAVILMLVGILTACSNGNETAQETETKNESVNIKQLVADYSAGVRQAEQASITSHQLIVKDGGEETIYDLPDDEFFVSIAPYIEVTHP